MACTHPADAGNGFMTDPQVNQLGTWLLVSPLLGMARILLGVRVRFSADRSPVLTSINMSVTGQMIVPVRTVSGMVSLRCGRLPAGERAGIAFTTEALLVAAMGAGQPWIQVSERALREMLEPLGITRIQVDPGMIAASLPVSVPA